MSNHIDHIEITNFKSIRHQKIEGCKRINVFIGYPNVGKSNILEALSLNCIPLLRLGESFHLNDLVRLHDFSELFYNRDYRSQLLIKLFYQKSNGKEKEIELTGNIDSNFNSCNIVFKEFLNENHSRSNVISDTSVNGNATIKNPNDQILYSFLNNGDKPITSLIKKYDYRSSVVLMLNRGFSLSIPFGGNLIDLLQRNFDFGKELVDIFKEYGLKIFLESDSISLTKELPNGISVRIPYHQMADTLRRLIFYKASIMSNENSVLLFEEPEAHMFPPYISKFTGDIIYNKENNNQYFINTHSPFVMNDFLEDARDELSVYVVGLKNGETVIKRLSDEQMHDVYQYGIDLFFNIERYLVD